MEAVEIIVYLVISIIIGGMILSFLTGWNIRQTYYDIKDAIKGDDTVSYQEVDKPGFVSMSLKLWESCGYGEIDKSVAVLVKDPSATGTLDSAYMLEVAKQLNIERSINADTLDFQQSISLAQPQVVRIRCDATAKKLVIGE